MPQDGMPQSVTDGCLSQHAGEKGLHYKPMTVLCTPSNWPAQPVHAMSSLLNFNLLGQSQAKLAKFISLWSDRVRETV